MIEAHQSRDKAIKSCIAQTSEVVGHLREARGKDNENMTLIKELRKEQTKVSWWLFCSSTLDGTKYLSFTQAIEVDYFIL